MSIITGHDLLEAGWQPGPEIGAALKAAAEYEARGIEDKTYLLKLVARAVPKTTPRIAPRDEPAPLAEAIEAVCDLFRGQEVSRSEFTVTLGAAGTTGDADASPLQGTVEGMAERPRRVAWATG